MISESMQDAAIPEQERKAPPGLRGYDAKLVSEMTSIDVSGPSPVQQHLRDEVDINTIVRRYGITGEMPFGNAGGVYGDFTGISDYEGALEMVERAQAGFMTLPPEIRERFQNDPGQLVAFARSVSEDEFSAAMQPAPPPDVGLSPPPADGGS